MANGGAIALGIVSAAALVTAVVVGTRSAAAKPSSSSSSPSGGGSSGASSGGGTPSGGGSGLAPNIVPPNTTVTVVGDESASELAYQLQTMLASVPANVANRGTKGNTIATTLAQASAFPLAPSSVVIASVGTYDSLQPASTNHAALALELVQKLATFSDHVIWLLPPQLSLAYDGAPPNSGLVPKPSEVTVVSDMKAAVAKVPVARIWDFTSAVQPDPSTHFPDDAGYSQWAQSLVARLTGNQAGSSEYARTVAWARRMPVAQTAGRAAMARRSPARPAWALR